MIEEIDDTTQKQLEDLGLKKWSDYIAYVKTGYVHHLLTDIPLQGLASIKRIIVRMEDYGLVFTYDELKIPSVVSTVGFVMTKKGVPIKRIFTWGNIKAWYDRHHKKVIDESKILELFVDDEFKNSEELDLERQGIELSKIKKNDKYFIF